MSGFRDIGANLASQLDAVVNTIARATAGPVLVRTTVVLATLGGFALGMPPSVFTSPEALALAVVAVMPGLLPRGVWPGTVIAVIIVGYLLATSEGTAVSVWRLIPLASSIYVIHTGAALAAVLPYDSVVSPGLFLPWVLRAAGVLVLTAGFAVFDLVLPGLIGSHRLVAATIGGMAVMILIAGYVAFLGGRVSRRP